MSPRILKLVITVFLTLYGLWGSCLVAFSQTPIITVRLANPQNSCVTEEYCLDVEFKSSLPDQEIFGMNVRFFYDDDILELVDFRDFQGGYGPVEPNPPVILTSSSAGPALFNFEGAAEFINGAMQLVNSSAPPIVLDSTTWTKIFQICFLVDDPNANLDTFCPPIVWDLEQDVENGGFLSGDDGVVISIVDPNGESLPAIENVVQFNWEYIGTGMPPFGQPIDSTCSNINCTLPLTLLSFTGIATEAGNQLNWQTNNEINVAGFDIQRRGQGLLWNSLGFVKSAGTSLHKQSYTYLDLYPSWGSDYYRLRQLDMDGKVQYSPIIRIEDVESRMNTEISVYPSPVSDGSIYIYANQIDADGSAIRLLDPTGQLVREAVMKGATTQLDIRGLSAGIYVVIISTGTENTCKKIVIY